MLLASRLGDGWLWYSLGVVVLLFGDEHRYHAFAAGGTAALAGILVFRTLKGISKRRRPCEIEPHCWAFISPPDRFSFPSGHSMTSCAMAVAVGHFYPQCQIPLFACAASIAASRIILGMHFLTDVMVGLLIGGALGYAAVCLFT
jgi:undecaprenyl-diphosphatase